MKTIFFFSLGIGISMLFMWASGIPFDQDTLTEMFMAFMMGFCAGILST